MKSLRAGCVSSGRPDRGAGGERDRLTPWRIEAARVGRGATTSGAGAAGALERAGAVQCASMGRRPGQALEGERDGARGAQSNRAARKSRSAALAKARSARSAHAHLVAASSAPSRGAAGCLACLYESSKPPAQCCSLARRWSLLGLSAHLSFDDTQRLETATPCLKPSSGCDPR